MNGVYWDSGITAWKQLISGKAEETKQLERIADSLETIANCMTEKSTPKIGHPAIWTKCTGCDEYICSYHGVHVADCLCPAIEIWHEAGMSPYTQSLSDGIGAWIDQNPHKD